MAKRTAAKAAADKENNDAAAESGTAAGTAEKAEAAPPPKPQRPNVKLAAEAEPLGAGALTVGMQVIGELPDEETQKKGWHCTFARMLLQLYPDRYKSIVEKGNRK